MSILFPDSKAPRTEQYKKAWADLSSSNRSDKAHAKCWLTYRAVDGEIKLDDWIKLISGHETTNISTRWTVSQATAEFFLWTLHDDAAKRDAAAAVVMSAPLIDWPDGLAHYCRIKSILALMQLIGGKHDECRATIESSVEYWQTHMGAFDYKTHANRFLELRYDVHAVNFMIWIGLELGFVKPNDALKGWIPESLKTQKQTPWWRCIEKTMDGVTGMWLPTLKDESLIAAYQQIHTNNPKYGSGPSAEEVDRIATILRDADVFHPDTVIDYGCGNSKLAETVFPGASIRLYDPAIEALSKPPQAGCYDIGLCTDVMEHIPEQDIAAMWAEMKALAPTWYFTIHTAQASQLLPDGRNAHVTQKPAEWWQQTLGGKIVWQKSVRFGLLVDSRP